MYVSNLGFHVEDQDLKQLFEPFGEVTSAKVIKDRDTGRSRGFGFVSMGSTEQANKAMASLHNKELEGRIMSVNVAKEKESRQRANRW